MWSRGEEEGCSDITKLLEMARTTVVMLTPCLVTNLLCVPGSECYFTAAWKVSSHPTHPHYIPLILITVSRLVILGVRINKPMHWPCIQSLSHPVQYTSFSTAYFQSVSVLSYRKRCLPRVNSKTELSNCH